MWTDWTLQSLAKIGIRNVLVAKDNVPVKVSAGGNEYISTATVKVTPPPQLMWPVWSDRVSCPNAASHVIADNVTRQRLVNAWFPLWIKGRCNDHCFNREINCFNSGCHWMWTHCLSVLQIETRSWNNQQHVRYIMRSLRTKSFPKRLTKVCPPQPARATMVVNPSTVNEGNPLNEHKELK